MADASGVAKLVGGAVDAARAAMPSGPGGEQLGLDLGASEDHLSLPDATEIVAIQMEHGCDLAGAVAEWRRRGAKGRKPGASNRRSEEFSRYLLQFGPHPGVALMRMIARPIDMLKEELGCTRLEAAELQRKVASELLPYFESRKPVELKGAPGAAMFIMAGVPGLDGTMAGIEAFASGGAIEADDPAQIHVELVDLSETAENRGFDDAAGALSE